MRLWNISINNLKRRRSKSAFLLVGLLIGVASVVSLATIVMTMGRDIEEKLDRFGANILISPRTEGLSLAYGGISMGGVSYAVSEIRAEDLALIDTIPNRGNIKVIAPKTLGVVDTSGGPALLAGIDVEREAALKQWWKVQGALPDNGHQLAAGSRAALNLGLRPGSTLRVAGRDFLVTGTIAETGAADDDLLFTTIPVAQELLGKEGLYSLVEVSALCNDCPVEDIVSQISSSLPGARVTAVRQVVDAKMQALGHMRRFSVGVSLVVLLVGSLMVLVTMMGSVKERIREIGIFRAIGFRRSHIVRIIILEAALVSLVAGLAGWAVGLLAARLSLPLFMEKAAGIYIHPALAPLALVLSLVIGLAASAYPALSATRLAPAEALKILE